MNNKEIAKSFSTLANLMTLHNENPFKVRSYSSAYISLRKVEEPFSSMSFSEISAIPGIGQSVADKVEELVRTGTLEVLEELYAVTPIGVRQLLQIKGLGPKKVKQIWEEMGILSPGELLYACYENRLVEYKGFGLKTQESLKQKIEYFQDSQDKSLFSNLEDDTKELVQWLTEQENVGQCAPVGELARKCPIIEDAEILIEGSVPKNSFASNDLFELLRYDDEGAQVKFKEKAKFAIHFTSEDNYQAELFNRIGSNDFISGWMNEFGPVEWAESQEDIFEQFDLHFIPSESREKAETIAIFENSAAPDLVTDESIKGILHNHSTYSDGLHSLMDMSKYVKESGYEYFGICDHSKSAGYAGGLWPEKVIQQWNEIDEINAALAPFKVFKGIESDILGDGSLDYNEDILKGFDFIVASVHSNLAMEEEKATKRLITAIENPYTRILGHPTGRLLLSRKGYPIDHKKVIDACAANKVVIELNANPLRLDMDYRWIQYAMEKDVMISINPDAHSKNAIHLVRYGVIAARKGLLTKEMCLNTKQLLDFESWINEK